MSRRHLLLPLLALGWLAAAVIVVGAPDPRAAMPMLFASTAAPSPGAVGGCVAWCAAAVVTLMAVIDGVTVLGRRRMPRLVTPPRLLLLTGATLLVVGCVCQMTAYRVCCAPPSERDTRR